MVAPNHQTDNTTHGGYDKSTMNQASDGMITSNLYGDEFLEYASFNSDIGSFNCNLPVEAIAQASPISNTSGPLFTSWKTNSPTKSSTQPQIDPHSGLPLKICSNCGSISTPSWRRCPEGRNLLCNACGLYQKLHNRPRPLRIREDGSVQVIRNVSSNNSSKNNNVCQNCRTTVTPIWRRSQGDRSLLLCNACALYLKTHNNYRPASASTTSTTTTTSSTSLHPHSINDYENK